jgi:hypothetical protein
MILVYDMSSSLTVTVLSSHDGVLEVFCRPAVSPRCHN